MPGSCATWRDRGIVPHPATLGSSTGGPRSRAAGACSRSGPEGAGGPAALGEGRAMRLAGVDHGGRWFGIALSDPTGTFASPLEAVEGEAAAIARLEELIADEGVGLIVVGLPRNMDGSLGSKAREVLAFAGKLGERLGAAVETWDERLTTVQAERYLRESGVRGRERSRKVNQ